MWELLSWYLPCHFHRITGCLNLPGTSGSHLIQPTSQAGSVVQDPLGFEYLQRMEIAQPLWATCASACSPTISWLSTEKIVSWCSETPPVFQFLPSAPCAVTGYLWEERRLPCFLYIFLPYCPCMYCSDIQACRILVIASLNIFQRYLVIFFLLNILSWVCNSEEDSLQCMAENNSVKRSGRILYSHFCHSYLYWKLGEEHFCCLFFHQAAVWIKWHFVIPWSSRTQCMSIIIGMLSYQSSFYPQIHVLLFKILFAKHDFYIFCYLQFF